MKVIRIPSLGLRSLGWTLPIGSIGLVLLAACGGGGRDSDPAVFGGCSYRDISGTARCTEIIDTPDGPDVHVRFSPDDPTAESRYRYKTDDSDLVLVHTGRNRSPDWVSQSRIQPGWEGPCVRKEILQGPCTPVLFVFPAMKGIHAQWAPKAGGRGKPFTRESAPAGP